MSFSLCLFPYLCTPVQVLSLCSSNIMENTTNKTKTHELWILALTTTAFTMITAISFYVYGYTKGYRQQTQDMSVASYNAGFRLGRYSTLSEVIFCEKVSTKAIRDSYKAIVRILYVRGELQSLEYSCGE